MGRAAGRDGHALRRNSGVMRQTRVEPAPHDRGSPAPRALKNLWYADFSRPGRDSGLLE
jgi:hypothetical protein